MQKRYIIMSDVPNTFIQTKLSRKELEERVIMKLAEVLVDMLVEIYGNYVIYEKNCKVLYVEVLRAVYGILVSVLLLYIKSEEDLEGTSFRCNIDDRGVANTKMNGKQYTIQWWFFKWLNE